MTGVLGRVRLAIAVVLFGVLPAYAVALVFANAAGDGLDEKVTDFENAFYPAARAILDGVSPYPAPDDPQLAAGTEYVYPPLTALVSIPLTAFSVEAAGFIVMGLLVVTVLAILWVLGIRDWRCYGLALLWPPVLSAIQTGNVTLPLALGAAVVWRYRDGARVAGATLGVTLAAKLFLWPLVLWLGFTRRIPAALLAVVAGVVVLLVTWAVIGFAGIGDYPELLRRVSELEEAAGLHRLRARPRPRLVGKPREGAVDRACNCSARRDRRLRASRRRAKSVRHRRSGCAGLLADRLASLLRTTPRRRGGCGAPSRAGVVRPPRDVRLHRDPQRDYRSRTP